MTIVTIDLPSGIKASDLGNVLVEFANQQGLHTRMTPTGFKFTRGLVPMECSPDFNRYIDQLAEQNGAKHEHF